MIPHQLPYNLNRKKMTPVWQKLLKAVPNCYTSISSGLPDEQGTFPSFRVSGKAHTILVIPVGHGNNIEHFCQALHPKIHRLVVLTATH